MSIPINLVEGFLGLSDAEKAQVNADIPIFARIISTATANKPLFDELLAEIQKVSEMKTINVLDEMPRIKALMLRAAPVFASLYADVKKVSPDAKILADAVAKEQQRFG